MVTMTGSIQLLYKDPRGANIPPLQTWDSYTVSLNTTDMTKQIVVPKIHRPVFQKDDVIAIRVKPKYATTLAIANSTIKIPVTIRNTRTNVVEESILYSGDFTEYTTAAMVAGVWTDWCYRTTLAGEEIKIGQKYGFNSRVLIVAST